MSFNHVGRVSKIALAAVVVVQASFPPFGYPECPCLSPNSALGTQIKKELGKDFPILFGLQGCKEYERNFEFPKNCSDKLPGIGPCLVNCRNNAESSCSKRWCYVDYAACAENKNKCKGNLGRLGGDTDPSCRERPSAVSSFFSGAVAHYSYATCGNLDSYTKDTVSANFDVVLRVAVKKNDGWPAAHSETFHVDALRPQIEGVDGLMIEAFHDMVFQYFTPKPRIQLTREFASAASMEIVSKQKWGHNTNLSTQEYELGQAEIENAACVLDVAVGTTDICVASIWNAPIGAVDSTKAAVDNTMVAFTPTVVSDNILLIVPYSSNKETSFWEDLFDKLAVPFQPFNPAVWVMMGFMTVMAGLVFFLTEIKEHSEDFPFPTKDYVILRFFRAQYFALQGLLGRRVELQSHTIPTKTGKFSFTFFIFVVFASYTASLTSNLVNIDRPHAIQSLNDVIEAKSKVCVLHSETIGNELLARHPGLRGLIVETTIDAVWSLVLSEMPQCEAVIMDEIEWISAQSGTFVRADCARNSSVCVKTPEGYPDLTRDCSRLRQVGDNLFTIDIAWPVAEHAKLAVRKAMVKYRASGAFQKKMFEFAGRMPTSKCPPKERFTNPGLTTDYFHGTIIISSGILLIAIVLSCTEVYTGKHISESLGYPDPWLEDVQAKYKKLIKSMKKIHKEKQAAQLANKETTSKGGHMITAGEMRAEDIQGATVVDEEMTMDGTTTLTLQTPDGQKRTLTFSSEGSPHRSAGHKELHAGSSDLLEMIDRIDKSRDGDIGA